jgi:ribosomal 50S subunit-recycling heat shock protein
MASKAIEEGRVFLNGARVKASREVKAGDVLEIAVGRSFRKVKVLEVPAGQLSKAVSRDFYSILDEKRVEDNLW